MSAETGAGSLSKAGLLSGTEDEDLGEFICVAS
jgi:hypothetical protein